MIQEDYFIRIIEEFFAALRRITKKQKDISGQLDALGRLYNTYLGDSSFYHMAGMDEVMESFSRWPEEERIYRMEIYYVEANLKEGLPKKYLQERALPLFSFIDAHSDTYSLDRLRKISELKKSIGG